MPKSIRGRIRLKQKNLIVRQLFEKESSTYTYLLADKESKEALIIDPVAECIERDLLLIKELSLNLKYILDTHVHADHVTSSWDLKEKTGASIALGERSGVSHADLLLKDSQELSFGSFSIKAILTPGHTNGCTTYSVENMLFTGDTLLIRGNGRTDFQQGSAKELYHSITEKLFSFPDETIIYPAHDYKGLTTSTIEEEKRHNPRIGGGKSLEQFSQIMSELNLPNPKKIDVAVPMNLKCGRT
ncbi:MAG: glyoxylase-like metal-dependent hydrolase (beta-lactamase superfamily II) [Bacteriovoracaceae bacterium]|jgi:glyoxylase-like metal-dependent hydrolase (beta-lactamase superfamily II)